MHYWQDYPEILAGRDNLKGGSWLGLNLAGRFCAVTNFRIVGNPNTQAKSRGQLVQQYLTAAETDKHFIAKLQTTHRQYNPFNLVFGTPKNIRIFCSEDESVHCLTDGFHGLSNGFVDQHWPKMSRGVQRLTELIGRHSEIEIDSLNVIMRDQSKADEHELPNTGLSQAMEKQLSSIFIRASEQSNYGTRTTSYLLYAHNHIKIHEFNYDQDARVTDQQVFTLPCSMSSS